MEKVWLFSLCSSLSPIQAITLHTLKIKFWCIFSVNIVIYFDILLERSLDLFSHYFISLTEVLPPFTMTQNGPRNVHVFGMLSRYFSSVRSHSSQAQVLYGHVDVFLHVLLYVRNVQRDWGDRYVYLIHKSEIYILILSFLKVFYYIKFINLPIFWWL